ncbi:MAG: hypothetical protein ACI9DC_004169 [Gammaproteobacteria bacterium]|jgi:hypothetical protein
MLGESRVGLLHQALLSPFCADGWSLGDWDLCIRQAARCDLSARLCLAFEDAGMLECVPDAPRLHLCAARTLIDKHRRDIHYEVECIADALRKVDCDVLLLKGAAYVLANLPLSRGRLFSDVDLMVPRNQLDAVEKALKREGWTSATEDSYDQSYYRQWSHELPPFVHAFRGTLLDVHHTILPPTAAPTPNAQKLLMDSRCVRGRVRVLDPVDMFLHSATHLFHEGEFSHGFRDTLDLKDLLESFAGEPAFAARLARRAREFGLQRIIHHALRTVQRFWPDTLSNDPQVGGAPGCGLQWMLDALFDRALAPMHPSCDDAFSASARFCLYLRGHWLRMPPRLLLPHLARKTIRRVRGGSDSH